MRILQIISGRNFNGAVRYALTVSERLAARGHDVTLLHRPEFDPTPFLPADSSLRHETSSLSRGPKEIRRIGDYCRARGIDVLHTHMSSAHAFGALLRIFYGVPCVASAHQLSIQLHWVVNDLVICHNEESMRYQRTRNTTLQEKKLMR